MTSASSKPRPRLVPNGIAYKVTDLVDSYHVYALRSP
jgi:hypothetical protein